MKFSDAILSAALLAALPGTPAFAGQEGSNYEIVLAGTTSSYLGVGTAEITSDRAKELKLHEEHGVEITAIEESGPASRAGLKKGDVVLEYNGQRVEGTEQFIRLVRETPSGREVRLLISRTGVPQTVAVVTGTRKMQVLRGDGMNFVIPPMPALAELPAAPMAMIQGWTRASSLGIEAESLSPQLAQYFGAKDGVLVRSVKSDSAAEKGGLKAGDIITRLDGKDVQSPQDITSLLRSTREKRTVALTVIRDKREISVNVTVEEDRWPMPRPAVAPIATRQPRM